MTQQLRLAVIGAGAMGRDHIRYIQDNPDAKLVAIADPMHESEELAKSIDVAWYADYNDMFDHVALDGVVIASPNGLHLPMARAALEAWRAATGGKTDQRRPGRRAHLREGGPRNRPSGIGRSASPA